MSADALDVSKFLPSQLLVLAKETICDAKLLGQKWGQKFHFTPKFSPELSPVGMGRGLRFLLPLDLNMSSHHSGPLQRLMENID